MTCELVVDNFAGGGGASTGIRMALGRDVDIAINHDESAIAMPPEPYEGPVSLMVKWCFPVVKGRHRDGEYRITKPDTDNLQKMLKDVMTQCGYWTDDAQVCREIVEKFWAEIPGIFIRVEVLHDTGS